MIQKKLIELNVLVFLLILVLNYYQKVKCKQEWKDLKYQEVIFLFNKLYI